MTSALRHPLCQKIRLRKLIRKQKLPWDIRRPGIKLLNKTCQDFRFCLIRVGPQIEVIPANEPSSTKEKYLHHSVPLFPCNRQDVPVLPRSPRVRNLLLLRNLFYTADQFPVLNGFFKFHLF